MGRTQPHGIAGHHGAAAPAIFNVPTQLVRSPQFGEKQASKAFFASRAPSRGWLCCFWPAGPEESLNASVGTSPRFCSRFRASGRSVSIGGEPVAMVDLIRGGFGMQSHQMLGLARLCSLMPCCFRFVTVF